jgi:hypothetical protein
LFVEYGGIKPGDKKQEGSSRAAIASKTLTLKDKSNNSHNKEPT